MRNDTQNRVRGEQHHNAKLSTANVRAIRKMRDSFSSRTLGRMFGVSKTQVRNICNNKQWRHVG